MDLLESEACSLPNWWANSDCPHCMLKEKMSGVWYSGRVYHWICRQRDRIIRDPKLAEITTLSSSWLWIFCSDMRLQKAENARIRSLRQKNLRAWVEDCSFSKNYNKSELPTIHFHFLGHFCEYLAKFRNTLIPDAAPFVPIIFFLQREHTGNHHWEQ